MQVYLDHSATTPLHPEVKKVIAEKMDLFGNPSSLHAFGRKVRKEIESARETIAEFIGAESNEIIFTGSGTEASNAVLSIFEHPDFTNKELIVSTIEHPCILETAKYLEKKGIAVKYLEVDSYGKIKLDQLNKKISKKTGLVAVMMANNEIGTIQDTKTIAEISHKHGALFYTDAVQTVGKIPVNVKELDVDFLSFSGHKIYAPKGIGGLYIKNKTPYVPLIRGGHQEFGKRAGTENTLGIMALAKAIEMRRKEMDEEEKHLANLKKTLHDAIKNNIPDIKFNGHPTNSLPGILNVSFAGAEGESILLYLDLEGIAISTGSACASGSLDPSHVLLAIGTEIEYAHGSLRISFGRDNTLEEVEYVATVLPKVIDRIRSMSPIYRSKA